MLLFVLVCSLTNHTQVNGKEGQLCKHLENKISNSVIMIIVIKKNLSENKIL